MKFTNEELDLLIELVTDHRDRVNTRTTEWKLADNLLDGLLREDAARNPPQ